MAQATKSAKIHAKLPHPVIDSDGHWVEYGPAADHYLEKELGSTGPQRYWHAVREYIGGPALNFDHEKRRKEGLSVLGWWAVPTKYTADRAAVMLPKLLHERIGDLGLDFAVMYPTAPSLTISPFIADDELRPPASAPSIPTPGICSATIGIASRRSRSFPRIPPRKRSTSSSMPGISGSKPS